MNAPEIHTNRTATPSRIRFLPALSLALVLACPISAQTTATSPADTTDEPVLLEEYNVTGSNIPRTAEEDILPISSFRSEDFQVIGAATVSEILETIPYSQNITINETETGANGARGDVTTINLRNLGSGRSLVLINGRRMAAHGVTPGTPPVAFVNLSSIPAAAIEQIEVLRDGASAIYGSDAIGGVLNTRLKRDYTGTDLSVRFSFSDPSRLQTNLNLASGFDFNEGKSNATVILSYYKRDPLMAPDRPYSAVADNRPLAPEPWASFSRLDRESSSSPWGRYTAVDDEGKSVRVTGVTANNGRFYIDPDTNAVRSGTGSAAIWNFQDEGQLIPSTERYSLYSTFDHEINDRLRLFGELSYYDAHSQTQAGTTPISQNTDGVVIPKTNYYNPVGTRFYGPGTANPDGIARDVVIRNYRPIELGPRTYETDSQSIRAVAGVEGSFSENWNFEASALYMRGEVYQDSQNAMSQSRLTASLARSDPNAMNPFGGPRVNPASVIDTFRITAWDEGIGTLGALDAHVNGELLDLPGGPLAMAAGVAYRREEMSQRNDSFGLADDIIAQSEQIDVDASRNVYAGYAEVLVPIIGRDNRATLFHSMELRLAGRYEDFGKEDTFKPGIGLSWALTDWLMFRTSYNEGFRAPAVSELFQPQRGRRNFLFDPARDGQEDASDTVSKLVITGGNPDLQPEESEAFNIGVVVDVKPIRGLSFSVDVYDIQQTDRIDNPNPQTELNLDAVLWANGGGSNARVTREAQTPADVALNIPGKLLFVSGTYQNLASRDVAGVDTTVMYRVPETSLGRFTLRAEASYTSKLETVDAEGNFSDLIRQTANPHWKGTGSLNWSKGNWSAGALMQHTSDYEDAGNYDIDGVPWIIDSWTTFNLNVGYAFRSGLLEGMSLRVGANNVLDEEPPLVVSIADSYDSSYHDPRGRTWWVQADYRF